MKLTQNSVKMVGKDAFLITTHKVQVIPVLPLFTPLFTYEVGKNHLSVLWYDATDGKNSVVTSDRY